MKTKFFFFIAGLGFVMLNVKGQTYTHPTTGLNGTYAGTCMVSTCSGTYYDNGGSGSNYSLNINQIYRTFCPATAGNCVRATFTSFSTENTYDYLRIRNGSYQTAPVLGTRTGNPIVPFVYTSSASSGCLTFDFTSDFSVTAAGWAATLSCVPCASQQTGTNSDCPNSTVICSNNSFTSSSPGPGLISDGCGTCIEGGETFSNWYVFSPQTSGTIGFTLTPSNMSDDYDFAIYGPSATNCGSLGSPIRCSYSANAGLTGCGSGAVDNTEGVSGNSWVAPLNVTAGQVYRLLITHWTPPSGTYTISWQLSGGATLDCTPLPIELQSFNCKSEENWVAIDWTTQLEINNDFFILEKSLDGINYEVVTTVKGSENSNELKQYVVFDDRPAFGTNYYRLSQTDIDGETKIFEPISCVFGDQLPTISEINIYDLNGYLILSEKENTNNLGSIVEHLQVLPGMYFMSITYDNGTTGIKKFVKI